MRLMKFKVDQFVYCVTPDTNLTRGKCYKVMVSHSDGIHVINDVDRLVKYANLRFEDSLSKAQEHYANQDKEIPNVEQELAQSSFASLEEKLEAWSRSVDKLRGRSNERGIVTALQELADILKEALKK